MEQRSEILGALEAVLGRYPGLAVVHSSLASLVPRVGVTRWDFLYAVRSLVDRGWTLAFPAFTFSFCRNGIYDPRSSASETGLLADWVLADLIGARRTDHPIYSFVVLGAQADEFDACTSQTTFGDDSPFGLFEQKNAHVVMLGSDWQCATPFHRYEEKAEVPYRKFKKFEGNMLLHTEAILASAVMYVRDLEIGAENDFSPLVKRLRSEDKIVKVSLWRCFVEATTMQAIRESAEAMLSADPLVFVKNAAEVRYRLEARAEAKRLAPYRVALLGMSNLDIAATQLEESLSQFIPDRRFEIYVPPFGQVSQQVLQAGSQLVSFDPELTIFADRLEDLLGDASPNLVKPEMILESVRQHAGLIRHFAQHNGGTVLLHRFALMGRYNVEDTAVLSALLTGCNSILDQTIGDLDNIFLIDMAAEYAQGVPAEDPRLWHLGRIPFSNPFTHHLVDRWAGIVLALLGKTARLLVLDLDNTLWGGVLGEDGETGISIGGDFPGNAFLRFQKTLKALSDRGIALAVCSKNDEDLALHVLGSNENVVIRPGDFVAHRINWQPKWINIREIAAELDLGLSSIMFIDDNPVERESVKRNLPMVKVLELPQDPTAYTDALLTSPFIEVFRSGREDRKRIASYKARRKINLERQSAASLENFLHELKMQLHIQPLNNRNLDRAAQLCHKTNQFNTTARRYTTRDLKRMASEGMDVAVIGLQDRLTEMENIGLILLRPDDSCLDIGHVDLFLLSCRVMGRTVEQAVLTWAMTHATRRGWLSLHGEIVETPRNTPVRSVFADNGFEAGSAKGLWQKITLHELPPDWFEITDDFSKGRD